MRVALTGLIATAAFLAAPLGPAMGAPTVTSCVPVAVAVFVPGPRIHVQCSAAVGGISYFATPTSDAASAARVLSILSTAQVAGRTLGIRYDPADLSGAGIGCQNNDCRLIMEVWFGQ
jgi:hypothetical protein